MRRPAARTSGWSPRRARGTASRDWRTSSRCWATPSGRTRSTPRPPTRSPPRSCRSYAWVETHWGSLHLRHDRLAEAEEHYERAEAAYSGYWLVDKHIAELRAAQDRLDEAITLCDDVAARTARPELAQAAGDLHRRAGQPDEARAWHERALAGYLESASLGEVQYHHHLAEYYADVEGDGDAAVLWAERDHALRPHYATDAALAWALHRAGRPDEALEAARRTLASGVRDPHVLRQAGAI